MRKEGYEQCAFCKIQSSIEQRLIERLVGLLQTEEAILMWQKR